MEKIHFTGDQVKDILIKYLMKSGDIKTDVDMSKVKLTAHNTIVNLDNVQIIIND